MANELIKEELTKEDFYIYSLSLYLQGQEDIKLRLLSYFNVLKNVKSSADKLFKILNIWDVNYFENTNIDKNSTECVWLDEIGLIFGCYRQIELANYVQSTSESDVTKTLYTLTNFNFLYYILATISKMTFDGQNETLLYFYNGSNLLNYDIYLKNSYNVDLMDNYIRNNIITQLGIIYVCLENSLTCNIYFSNFLQVGDDVTRKLFLNGLLTIESMGIKYTRELKAKESVFYGRIQGNKNANPAPFLCNFFTTANENHTETFSHNNESISVTYNFSNQNGLNSISATSNFTNINIFTFNDQQERRFQYDSSNSYWKAYRGNISLNVSSTSNLVFEDSVLGQTFSLINATNNSIEQIQYKANENSDYIPIKADRYCFAGTGNNQLVLDIDYSYNNTPLMQVAFGNMAINTLSEKSDIQISLRCKNIMTDLLNPIGMIGGNN